MKVCSQRTITIGPETGAKTWQALKYGGPEWQKIYFRLQNSVEGCNGYAKNALTKASQSAGSRRITEQSILLALHVAHANRRKNKNSCPRCLSAANTCDDSRHRRQAKAPWGAWLPTGHPGI
ncbi:hypothetical protein [Streptomyces hokutonensis]|uniref:hypothetical protein n=1 Tax=Streptomyces hokutonensis TaxID=1306990 RepID=UPI003802B39B